MTPSKVQFTVSEFLAVCNQILEYSFTGVMVEGEIASFKVNQGKWVFFDLKEGDETLNCFLPLTSLNVALSDGMKVRVRATPKLTRWGKFSLTVSAILPLGEGSIKKSFELLKKKLTAEGLFDSAKKRPLPENLTKIGVISSTQAAGYHDFLKILNNRWGGLQISTINTQVQGLPAVDQIIHALESFNQRGIVDVIALVRGGGSADDLAIFNDERLVRAIAASRIPVITGIGHEVDESLADLAADVRASTPSNAAERLTPDKAALLAQIRQTKSQLGRRLLELIQRERAELRRTLASLPERIIQYIKLTKNQINEKRQILETLNPENVLQRGYAIIRQRESDYYQAGDTITLTTYRQNLTAEVKHVQNRN